MRRLYLGFFDLGINVLVWEMISYGFNSPISLIIQVALYYLLCYILFKRTIAQYLLGYHIVYNGVFDIIKREVIKFSILAVPFIYFLENNYFIYPILALSIGGILTLLYFLFYKRNIWETLSQTHFEKQNQPKWYWVLSLLILVVANVFAKTYQLKQTEPNILASVRLNYFGKKYASKYVDFLKEKETLAAVDYIFSLFGKYDQVILCERTHPEETQWNLIYDIVKDPRFSENNTVIFTEYGNSFYQSELDSFLNTTYPSEEERLKATAKIMLPASGIYPIWSSTNWFNFLSKLNQLNSSLPPEQKRQLYFTNVAFNWDTLQLYGLQGLWKNNDRLFSQCIINKIEAFKQAHIQHKSLIIMNYRHAFKLHKNPEHESVANYIFEQYPHSTANVLINTLTNWGGFIYFPIQGGDWDNAFKENGNKNIGLDFANSPFGEDNFDLYISDNRKRYKYREVFTGLVFWEPLENHTLSEGFPYMCDNKEEILRRANKQGIKDLEMGLGFERLLKRVKNKPIRQVRNKYFIALFLIKFTVYIILSLYTIIVLLILLFKSLSKNQIN